MTSMKHLTLFFLGLTVLCIHPPTAIETVLVKAESPILTPATIGPVVPAASRTDQNCKRADVVFVVDSSSSINNQDDRNWDRVKSFLVKTTRQLSSYGDVRFGLVLFSDRGKIILELSKYQDINDTLSKIRNLVYLAGQRNMADGLEVARTEVFTGARPGVLKLAILINDGIPNIRVSDTISQTILLKKEGVRIIAVAGGTTNEVNNDLLKFIATNPGDVFLFPDFLLLADRASDTVELICNGRDLPISTHKPTLAPQPPASSTPGPTLDPTPGYECINGYHLYPYTRRMGGNRNAAGNTTEKCRNICNNDTKCWGYTYESGNGKIACYIYSSKTIRSSSYQYYYKGINGEYTTQENQAHLGGLKYTDYLTQEDCQLLCDSFPSCTGYTIQKNKGDRKICRIHIYAFLQTGVATHNHYQVCGSGRNGKTYR